MALALGVLTACSGGSSSGTSASTAATTASATSSSSSPTPAQPTTVRLLTHDSFAVSQDLLDAFQARTGIEVQIITAGDAGEMVNKSVLSAGKPDADVLFGIDTTLLSRALEAGVFDPYTSPEAATLRPELAGLGAGVVTPIDDGDVCVNIDDAWFASKGIAPPTTLEDLAKPEYKGLLVVENPATSSPGLDFLLATVAKLGTGWQDYWGALKANDVKVVDGWEAAYEGEFTAGGGGGDRPLVVSYSTSPPAEIVYAADPKPDHPSTSSMTDGCYHQVEFAGVLRGAQNPQAAQQVVDWLLSPEVQADVPLSMFVFPARAGVALPDVFASFVTRPEKPLELDAQQIEDNRDSWIKEWTDIVMR